MLAALSASATAALSASPMPANRSRCGAPDIADHSSAAPPSRPTRPIIGMLRWIAGWLVKPLARSRTAEVPTPALIGADEAMTGAEEGMMSAIDYTGMLMMSL